MIVSDILEIHNFVETIIKYENMDLLEKHKGVTHALEINVCKHIVMVIIVCPICMH